MLTRTDRVAPIEKTKLCKKYIKTILVHDYMISLFCDPGVNLPQTNYYKTFNIKISKNAKKNIKIKQQHE